MKNADESELKLLASPPVDVSVHSVLDFPQLGTLTGLLSWLICQQVQGRYLAGAIGEGRPWGQGSWLAGRSCV